MKITLPSAAEWSGAENCAINLRSVRSAGVKMCEPVGMPAVVLAQAGASTFLLDGDDILSVTDDRHDLCLNGQPIGALANALVNVLPLGIPGEAVLFTADGPQWISGGNLQPALAESCGGVIPAKGAEGGGMTSDILLPDLRGNYARLSGVLDDDDTLRVVNACNDSLALLMARAEDAGMFAQPVRVACRMVDADGHVLWAGTPVELGTPQGAGTHTFRLTQADGVLSMAAAAAITLNPWPLRIEVKRSNSAYWRGRVAALEVVAWPARHTLVNRGCVLSHSGDVISLHATMELDSDTRVPGAPRIVARVNKPLDGVNINLTADFAGEETDWNDSTSLLTPSVVYRGGTLTAYADASRPGMLMLAHGDDPLSIKSEHKICGGNIVQICAPVGGGGGWNYGRLHLLAFATDGIYSVSVDSKLLNATSTCVNYFGVPSSEAVAVTPTAVYVANQIGQLLRIVGSRCSMVPFPSEVARLAWNGDRAELWAINPMGAAFVMDADGGVALRSNVYVDRVVGQRMIVDTFGALRTLRVEEPQPVNVNWTCRREDRFRNRVRLARWKIDAAKASNLMLRLWADNGGASQRLLELKVDGIINAPISASVICPTRAYFTAQIHGTLTPPARLNSLEICS